MKCPLWHSFLSGRFGGGAHAAQVLDPFPPPSIGLKFMFDFYDGERGGREGVSKNTYTASERNPQSH